MKGGGDDSGKYFSWYAASIAASYAVTAINPYGVHYPLAILNLAFSQHDDYLKLIGEYGSMWKALGFNSTALTMVAAWAMTGMLILFIGMTMYLLLKKRRFDWPVFFTNIMFFLFGMSLSRATFFFPIVLFFSLVYHAGEHIPSFERKIAFPAFMILVLVAGIAIRQAMIVNPDPPLTLKVKTFVYPEKEVAYILENDLPGPVFNDYSIGGSLIWGLYPRYKVFIDPRYGPYRKSDFWGPYWSLQQKPTKDNFTALESLRPFNTAVVLLYYNTLLSAFFQSPDWTLVHFDTVAAVFVRTSRLPAHLRNNGAKGIDLAGDGFRDETNTQTLVGLFRVNSMVSFQGAKNIRDIYERNVRSIYYKRDIDLKWMDEALELMKSPR